MKKLGFIFALSFAFTGHLVASQNSLPWFGPTTTPLKAAIEKDFNFKFTLGGSFAAGKGRDNFLDIGSWEKGWIGRTVWAETGFGYAPNSNWEFGLQVPITILSSTINVHHAFNESLAAGIKLGLFSSAYGTATVYPGSNWFLSFSPEVGLNQFGVADGPEKNSDSNSRAEIDESKFTVGGQLTIGNHVAPSDIALIVHYAYAVDGEGIENSYIFDDILMRHFLKVGLSGSF